MQADSLEASFVLEAEDLLAKMEDGLIDLEQDPTAYGLLDEIFRAGHTIKGGAGLVDLQEIVKFTHVLENVLDRLRKRELEITPKIISVLLGAKDVLTSLVSQVAQPSIGPVNYEDLLECLKQFSTVSSSEASQVTGEILPQNDGLLRTYLLRLKLSDDVIETGQDPYMLLYELFEVGDIVDIESDISSIPKIQSFVLLRLYIQWKILLQTDLGKTVIDDVFMFVEDEADLEIREVMDCRHF